MAAAGSSGGIAGWARMERAAGRRRRETSATSSMGDSALDVVRPRNSSRCYHATMPKKIDDIVNPPTPPEEAPTAQSRILLLLGRAKEDGNGLSREEILNGLRVDWDELTGNKGANDLARVLSLLFAREPTAAIEASHKEALEDLVAKRLVKHRKLGDVDWYWLPG